MGMDKLSKQSRKLRERRQARLVNKRALPLIITEQLEEEHQPAIVLNTFQRQRRARIIAGFDPKTDRKFKTPDQYTSAITALAAQHPLTEDEDTEVSDTFFVIDCGVSFMSESNRLDTEFGPADGLINDDDLGTTRRYPAFA